MPSMTSKRYVLSEPATDAFEEFRRQLFGLRKLEPNAPSASVSIEFLVWWFYETRTLEGVPRVAKFSPVTRKGRRALGEFAQPIAPSLAREGLGLDPIVQKRKLR